MKPNLSLIIIAALSIFSEADAQTIATDSRGKEVFSFYKTKALSVPVTAATASAKINYTLPLDGGTQYYVSRFKDKNDTQIIDTNEIIRKSGSKGYESHDSLRFTMAKSTGLNLSLGVGNILSNLAKVSTFHPTYSAGIGIGRNIDIFNNWENIRSLKLPFHTWNINIYGKLDNFMLFDTIAALEVPNKAQYRKKPVSGGAIVEGTVFFPRITRYWKRKWLVAVSGSFNYELGNNLSTLKNYQKNTPIYQREDIISLGDYIGKLGDFKNENSIRARFALPLFPEAINLFRTKSDSKSAESLQLCVIPYYSFYGSIHSKLTNLMGVYLNGTQGNRLFTQNSTIISGFGIGIDWRLSGYKFHETSVFVAGSLDLHAIFDHKKPLLSN